MGSSVRRTSAVPRGTFGKSEQVYVCIIRVLYFVRYASNADVLVVCLNCVCVFARVGSESHRFDEKVVRKVQLVHRRCARSMQSL